MLAKLMDGQLNLLVLMSAFIIAASFSKTQLMMGVLGHLFHRFKEKSTGLAIISALAGILPIEGRVTVSAPVLDSALTRHQHGGGCGCNRSRGDMGVVDYLANHHYYLWSPLEKTVILLMSVLGLSYGEVLLYNALPLLFYFLYVDYVLKERIDYSAVAFVTPDKPVSMWKLLPFFGGIVASIFVEPYFVFPLVALFYAVDARLGAVETIKAIRWKPILLVGAVILVANIFKMNLSKFEWLFQMSGLAQGPDQNIAYVLMAIVMAGFLAFLMGSSGKYIAITVGLVSVIGMPWLPIVLMVEYAMYLVSPMHKCAAISASYFGTRVFDFYETISQLALLMVLSGVVVAAALWFGLLYTGLAVLLLFVAPACYFFYRMDRFMIH